MLSFHLEAVVSSAVEVDIFTLDNSQVPSGTAIASPVDTRPLSLAGITISFAAYRSYPAAKADPRVGARASGISFLTSNWVDGKVVAADGVSVVSGIAMAATLGRLASGEFGNEGAAWGFSSALEVGGGVASLGFVIAALVGHFMNLYVSCWSF